MSPEAKKSHIRQTLVELKYYQLPFSPETLAEEIGCKKTSLNKHLKDLKNQDGIEFKYNPISEKTEAYIKPTAYISEELQIMALLGLANDTDLNLPDSSAPNPKKILTRKTFPDDISL